MESAGRPPYIAIARIARPRGNRGEVLADLYTDNPARFNSLGAVWLEFADLSRERHILEHAWVHNGRQVLKFTGIDTISAAERFSGAWVEIESDQAVKLPDGTYFDHDLIGCTAYDGAGRNLGIVKDILHIAGNDQLIVEGEQGEYLVPANQTICKEVCIAEKRILLDPPPGLIDLNK